MSNYRTVLTINLTDFTDTFHGYKCYPSWLPYLNSTIINTCKIVNHEKHIFDW
jgi:hypothetical protein